MKDCTDGQETIEVPSLPKQRRSLWGLGLDLIRFDNHFLVHTFLATNRNLNLLQIMHPQVTRESRGLDLCVICSFVLSRHMFPLDNANYAFIFYAVGVAQ